MQVTIPFVGSRWPPQCPCCGQPADSVLPLQRSRGVFLVVAATETVLRLEVPYCKGCVRHARRFQAGTLGGLLYPAAIVMAGAFFAGIIGLAAGAGRGVELLMMLGLPALATALFVGYRLLMRARAAVDARHSSTAPVLRIRSWTDYAIELDCDNASYGVALRQANAQ